MKTIFLCAVLPLLVGCATTAKYEERLRSWVGQPESKLIESWGPPSSVYDDNGIRMITFSNVGETQTYGYVNAGGVNATSVTNWCKTTFTVDSSRVIQKWQWQGNDCRSH